MILLIGLTGLAFAFVILWFAWPDPDGARPGDIKESDLLPLTKRTTPSHVLDVWAGMAETEYIPAARPGCEHMCRDDMPNNWVAWIATCLKCGEKFHFTRKRVCANCDRPFVPALATDEICDHCIAVGHGQIRAGRFVATN